MSSVPRKPGIFWKRFPPSQLRQIVTQVNPRNPSVPHPRCPLSLADVQAYSKEQIIAQLVLHAKVYDQRCFDQWCEHFRDLKSSLAGGSGNDRDRDNGRSLRGSLSQGVSPASAAVATAGAVSAGAASISSLVCRRSPYGSRLPDATPPEAASLPPAHISPACRTISSYDRLGNVPKSLSHDIQDPPTRSHPHIERRGGDREERRRRSRVESVGVKTAREERSKSAPRARLELTGYPNDLPYDGGADRRHQNDVRHQDDARHQDDVRNGREARQLREARLLALQSAPSPQAAPVTPIASQTPCDCDEMPLIEGTPLLSVCRAKMNPINPNPKMRNPETGKTMRSKPDSDIDDAQPTFTRNAKVSAGERPTTTAASASEAGAETACFRKISSQNVPLGRDRGRTSIRKSMREGSVGSEHHIWTANRSAPAESSFLEPLQSLQPLQSNIKGNAEEKRGGAEREGCTFRHGSSLLSQENRKPEKLRSAEILSQAAEPARSFADDTRLRVSRIGSVSSVRSVAQPKSPVYREMPSYPESARLRVPRSSRAGGTSLESSAPPAGLEACGGLGVERPPEVYCGLACKEAVTPGTFANSHTPMPITRAATVPVPGPGKGRILEGSRARLGATTSVVQSMRKSEREGTAVSRGSRRPNESRENRENRENRDTGENREDAKNGEYRQRGDRERGKEERERALRRSKRTSLNARPLNVKCDGEAVKSIQGSKCLARGEALSSPGGTIGHIACPPRGEKLISRMTRACLPSFISKILLPASPSILKALPPSTPLPTSPSVRAATSPSRSPPSRTILLQPLSAGLLIVSASCLIILIKLNAFPVVFLPGFGFLTSRLPGAFHPMPVSPQLIPERFCGGAVARNCTPCPGNAQCVDGRAICPLYAYVRRESSSLFLLRDRWTCKSYRQELEALALKPLPALAEHLRRLDDRRTCESDGVVAGRASEEEGGSALGSAAPPFVNAWDLFDDFVAPLADELKDDWYANALALQRRQKSVHPYDDMISSFAPSNAHAASGAEQYLSQSLTHPHFPVLNEVLARSTPTAEVMRRSRRRTKSVDASAGNESLSDAEKDSLGQMKRSELMTIWFGLDRKILKSYGILKPENLDFSLAATSKRRLIRCIFRANALKIGLAALSIPAAAFIAHITS